MEYQHHHETQVNYQLINRITKDQISISDA